MISSIKFLKSVRVTLVEGRIKLHGGAALCEYTRSTNYLKVQVLVINLVHLEQVQVLEVVVDLQLYMYMYMYMLLLYVDQVQVLECPCLNLESTTKFSRTLNLDFLQVGSG